MNTDEIEYWLNLSNKLAINVENAIKQSRDDPLNNNVTKIGADGTPTHKIDEYAEDAAIETLKNSEKSLILISEEIGTITIGEDDAKFLMVLDPLDGTSNAMKNLPCYGISIAIAEIKNGEPIEEITLNDVEIGYVKNFANGDVYTAVKGKGAKKNNKPMSKISNITKIDESTLCTYIYRTKNQKVKELCSSVRRMRILGSIAIELCYVAEGTYDIFLDEGKIIRIFDIAAGQLILKENNGIITDRYSEKLVNNLTLTEKTSLVACANKKLHENVINLLN